MKNLWILLVGLFVAVPAWAQLQAQTLSTESLYNSKKLEVGNLNQEKGIQIKVNSLFRGEPAMYPFRLQTYIKCGKNQNYKVMDIAKVIIDKYPSDFARMVTAPSKSFPNGVVQVCALENVNYDQEKIFITVFEPGSEHCDRTKVMDLIFPISEFCQQ